MDLELDSPETRVLGCLMEKEAATPEYYPLTLNALVNACNQKSNREPVVSYDADTVEAALDSLRAKGLAVRITGAEIRVPKHAHRLSETLNLGRRESAILAELMLRGPQTPGELRAHAERMHHFDDVAEVDSVLTRLMEWQPAPLAARLSRQPGSRETRYAHLLAGPPPAQASTPEPAAASPDLLRRLQDAVAALQTEVDDLKRELRDFRKGFE
jgi:uncharacterized protein